MLLAAALLSCEEEQAAGRSDPLWAPPGAACPVHAHPFKTPTNDWLGAIDLLNDEEELFIEVIGTGEHDLVDVQMWVGTGSPPTDPSTYPYQRDFSSAPVHKTLFTLSLADLSFSCGTELKIVVHGHAIKAGVTKEGWSHGTPLAGTNGWYLTYTICCECGDSGVAGDDSVCNGVDDDCDGSTDEGFASTTTNCGSGACATTGSTSCVDGSVVDSCAPETIDASCDGVDDDCDTVFDEDYASTPTSCGVGACATTGATSCVSGAVTDSCAPGTPAASDESCDGVDEDCDATADEDYTSVTTSCGVGACAASGTTSCIAGSVEDSCTAGSPAASDPTCDGVDDDCSGVADEDYTSVATSCGVGVCAAAGATSCVSGAVQDSCVPGGATGDDSTCDGSDDDCDGAADESYAAVPTSCGIGACIAAGNLVCSAGATADTCTPGTPAADDATCDTIDDDCDGSIDEDCSSAVSCVDYGATCGTIPDGFGGTLDCGTCLFPETCGGGGTANVCGVPVLPPDPVTVVPPAPNGVRDTFLDAFAFFFEGSNPVQQGTTADAFESHSAAGVRGRVLDTAGSPLAGVRVEVLNHPEIGWTFTRADGYFDLIVNGGGELTLAFAEDNYLPVHRRVSMAWGAYGSPGDVVLTRLSTVATPVTFDSVNPQVASGEVVTDDDGPRQLTVYFPPGVSATALVNGTSTPLSSGRVRATEYTVGATGPDAMPGDLTDASMYTYAVELTLDEVGPLGDVQFSAPVSLYLDNFLGFPVGIAVPLGSYNREAARWQPERDGHVAAVVGLDGDLAEIDLDGDGVAESTTALDAWSIDNEERRAIADRFAVGESFWRLLVDHFTPHDPNLSGRKRLPPDPKDPERIARLSPECQPRASGSIIGCASQSLGEAVPIAGTDSVLNYQSDRVRANTIDERTLRLDLSGYAYGPDAEGIHVVVEVLGRTLFDGEVVPGTAEVLVEWDGLDAFGREWMRPTQARVHVDSVAFSQYTVFPAAAGLTVADESFGKLGPTCVPGTDPCCVTGSASVLAGRLDRTSSGWSSHLTFTLGAMTNESIGLGGWGLSDYHAYSSLTAELALGSGITIRDDTPEASVEAVVGRESDNSPFTETVPGSATGSDIYRVQDLAVSASGTIYFVSLDANQRGQIWAATLHDELIPILAGPTLTPDAWSMWETTRTSTGASLGGPARLAVDGDENIYFVVEDPHNRVYLMRRDQDTVTSIEHVAGPGNVSGPPLWQEGQPLTSGALYADYLAARPDGTLIIVNRYVYSPTPPAWSYRSQIVERQPDGTGRVLFDDTKFYEIEVGAAGQLFVADGTGVLELFPDFTTRRVVTHSGARHLAVTPQGDIFTTNAFSNVGDLYRTRAGRTEHISFGGLPGTAFRGPPPPWGSAIHNLEAMPDGTVVINDLQYQRIVVRRFESRPLGYRVPSPDASEVYYFDDRGLHQRTDDALTGVTLRSFAHDAEGRLVSMTHADGRVTSFTRPAPNTIVIEAPAGSGGVPVTTTLSLNAAGYVDTITDPEGAVWAFDYDAGGLMRRAWRPRQNVGGARTGTPSVFDYERTDGPQEQALLIRDTDPDGGVQSLSSTHYEGDRTPQLATWCDGSSYVAGWNLSNIFTEVTRTTATGQEYRYRSSKSTPGDRITHTITDPSGRVQSYSERNGEHRRTQTWPGGSLTTTELADPVVGSDGRYISAATLSVSAVSGRSGLTANMTASRTATLGPFSGVDLGDVSAWQETTTINGDTSVVQYDGPTRTLRSTSAEGRESEVVLDAAGRLIETRLPGQVPTTFTYDAAGRLQSAVRTNGTVERRVDYEYDARGYVSRVSSPASATQTLDTRYSDNDLRGLPREVEIVGAGTTSVSRDVEGLATGVTPPTQSQHQFDYTGIGLATEYRPPGVMSTPTAGDCPSGAECVVYDSARRVASAVRADGATVTPTYAATTGLVTSVADSADGTWGYSYDGSGRVTGVTSPDGGSMTFGWQSDLPIFATWSGTHTVVRDSTTVWSGTLAGRVDAHYNNDLQVRRIAVQNGRSLDFTYDADGLLNYVAPTTGTPFPPLTIARSVLDGHIESTTLGVVTTSESVDVSTTSPGFGDYLGRTVAIGGTTFYQSSYTHDRLGRIVGWNETIDGTTKNRTFEFDDAGRLTNVRDGVGTLLSEYAYDANGNRTLADVGGVRRELGVDIGCGAGLTDAANDQDQLCRYGNYLYTYDESGRLAQKAHVTDGSDVTAYTYAGDGRLLRVELPFGGSVIDYVHDATGRRIGRIVDGVFDRGWLYKDGINPVAQLDATGAVEATFVYATRPHVPDFMVMTDGTTYRFVTDHLGSVRALVDATSGTVTERIDYDEWGNVTASSGAWSVQPFGFAGGLHDAATGLVRFGVRDYDPVTGTWTAKEPLGFGGGDTNFYAYSLGDPINLVDPDGRDALAVANWLDAHGVDDFAAGFGDWISGGFTAWMRSGEAAEIVVSTCSGGYQGGQWAGVAYELVGLLLGLRGAQQPGFQPGQRLRQLSGREIAFSRNFRVAPLGNRTGHPIGRWPHYHRRGVDRATGQTRPGQGIGRHRPWEKKASDKSFWDRF